jgi:hypothetical protein
VNDYGDDYGGRFASLVIRSRRRRRQPIPRSYSLGGLDEKGESVNENGLPVRSVCRQVARSRPSNRGVKSAV